MTRLLVSVRSLDEALLAAAAAVDLIDVKEPAHGPLGMAAAEVRREIGQQLGAKHKLSAACGELRDYVARSVHEGDKIDEATSDPYHPAAWAGYRFAKIGLAGCAMDSNWQQKWLAWRAQLPAFVQPVLVCYADGEGCDAPSFEDMRRFATQVGIGMLLFDTWDKSGPGLCELWQAADFLRIGQELRQAKVAYVLAGKLGIGDVYGLRRWGASYLGIRSAVCDVASSGDDARCGKLNAAKIEAWRHSLRQVATNTIHQAT